MMTADKQTCEDRIAEHLASRARDFEIYLSDAEVYDEGNEELPPFQHYGLSFDWREDENTERRVSRDLLLSWGGPSDFVRFHEDGFITYHFQDWFDGATREVTGEPWAQQLREYYEDLGMLSFETDRWGRPQ